MRDLKIIKNVVENSDGSCLITCGKTRIICTATIENKLPPFLRGQNSGWLSAEYAMLPAATHERNRREVTQGKASGRTQEIQRLIGRSLRASLDLAKLGPRQILVDCDVINADGGTRVTAITGGFVALSLACKKLATSPILTNIAAISCVLRDGQVIVDADYADDCRADVDANFVYNRALKLIEVQAAAERDSFSNAALIQMLEATQAEMQNIFSIQDQAINN